MKACLNPSLALAVLSAALLLTAGCQSKPKAPPSVTLDYPASHAIALYPKGDMLAVGIGSTLHHFGTVQLDPSQSQHGSGGSSTTFYRLEIADVAISPRGDLVAAGGWGQIQVQNGVGPTGGGGDKADIDTKGEMVWALAFNEKGDLLAASSGVYEIATAKKRFDFNVGVGDEATRISPEIVTALRFSLDDKTLIVVAQDAVHEFDPLSGAVLRSTAACEMGMGLPGAVAFSRKADRIAYVGSKTGLSICQRSESGWGLHAKKNDTLSAEALAWSPDSKWLALASRQSLVKVNAETLEIVATIDMMKTEQKFLSTSSSLAPAILDVTWDLKGERVYAAHADNTVVAYTFE